MEKKAVPFELKDFSAGSRTAVIAHAVYNNIDRAGDISRKGMFTKSWKENKNIDFLFNHEEKAVVGNVTRVFEDEEKAYTEVKFGNWTLGNDVLEMAEAGVLKGASFGYVAEKKSFITVKGKKVRELKEVYHGETSLLTVMPCNPLAGVVSLTKSLEGMEIKQLSPTEQEALKKILVNDQSILEQLILLSGSLDVTSDLYTWINWNISSRANAMGDIRSQLKWNSGEIAQAKSYIDTVERFTRNGKASDECIFSLQNELEAVKSVVYNYDTASTPKVVANTEEQPASIGEKKDSPNNDILIKLNLLNLSL